VAFELSTAVPVEDSQQVVTGGFDLSTAAPVEEIAPEAPIDAQPVQAVSPVSDEPLPEGGVMDAITEPVMSVTGSLAGQAASGLTGLYDLATGGDLESATKSIESTQDVFSEATAPQTQAGQKGLETVGDIMEKGVNIARIPLSGLSGIGELIAGQDVNQAAETVRSVQEIGFGKTVGTRVLDETGSPLAATIAETSPEIFASMIPIARMGQARRQLNTDLATKIQSGDTDRKLAKYIVDGAGKAKADPLYKPLVKQGFDQGALSAFKGSSDVDKSKLLDMLAIKRKGKENTLYSVKNRPSDVAGDSLIERVNFVKKVNRDAGKNLAVEANKLKGQQVDFAQPIDNFMNTLDEMGVTIDKKFQPVFNGSDIEGLTAPQNAIKNIVKRLASGKRGEMPDAYDLHRLKKYIDETVTYGKQGEGLAGKTESVLKKLRADVDNVLDTNFPDYDNVNSIYADTISSLDSLQDVAGKKMNLSGDNANKATGTLLRRMMSNAQSRVNLVDAVDLLEETAKKYGGVFDDDIATQMLFADELDAVFGASARTSLQGDVAKSVQTGIDKATGGKSALGKAADIAKSGVDKIIGKDEAQVFDMLKEMLERKPSPWEG